MNERYCMQWIADHLLTIERKSLDNVRQVVITWQHGDQIAETKGLNLLDCICGAMVYQDTGNDGISGTIICG